MSGARPWTPERLALLRAGFPTRPDVDLLLAEINALPGPKIERQGLNAKAHVLGMKRDPAVRAEILRTSGREGNAKRVMIGGALKKRTPERVALIRAEWPRCLDREGLLARVNALPGQPIRSVKALKSTARALGLRMDDETAWLAMSAGGKRGRAMALPRVRRARAPRVEAVAAEPVVEIVPQPEPRVEPTLAQQAAMADAAMERRLERARDMLRRKKDAAMIAANTRLPLREVFRLAGEMRRG